MHISSKNLLLCSFPVAFAQYGAPAGGSTTSSTAAAGPASTTSSSTASIQTVTVGANNALAFSPNTITANVGTSIEFIFSPPIHSVVQSSFSSPCAPLANNTGFYSGAFNTTSGTNTNAFTITVNNTNPIWFYCGSPSHCELGMVGVINPPSDGSSTLAQYKAAAANVSNPAVPSVVQGGSIGPAKAASTGSSTSSAATTSTTSATKNVGSRGIETGGSARWVVTALTGLLAVGFGSLIM